ncbi:MULTISPECIES: PepSY domain-containing protein [unclassified Streptomyces]|uniref:PepSY domain-containing protein n=1 Tax=unclassified Streptomyces TaxID=2593676 RepID=UPI000DB9E5A6|nr:MULTISPECIES: PepSY domain-containing protein [unclassified Streptomyces]MYT72400.1 peptidase propeptide and YpeB domain protein [Streptomyces sp. SID8367]RAJ70967.1 peptidase YpeB-like protein [Streptomyces sp. PsTaAH-137]
MKRRTTVISAIAAVALIGGGTATAVALSDDGNPDTTASRSSVTVKDDGVSDAQENANEAKGARITAEDAIAAALKHTPGVAAEADLDSDDGRLVWDVDVIGSGAARHHIEVDPGTGKVLGSHVEKDDDDDDPARAAAALKNASTSASDAARVAAAKGTVTSVDADIDGAGAGAVTVWEVETTSANGVEHDWHVDLSSGALTVDRSSDDD